MSISVLLLDADGVIQQTSSNWLPSWEALTGGGQNTDQFLSEVFEMEFPFLCGGDGFETELERVLERWGCPDAVQRALRIWTMIDPCEDILNLIEPIKNSGVQVGLATNQQDYRSRYMTKELGYGEIFDHLFVSCEMGVMKPSTQYFLRIIQRIGCPAEEILFIDDHEGNVEAAREVGLNAELFDLKTGSHDMKIILQKYGIPVV